MRTAIAHLYSSIRVFFLASLIFESRKIYTANNSNNNNNNNDNNNNNYNNKIDSDQYAVM